jgi:hypothetical protein
MLKMSKQVQAGQVWRITHVAQARLLNETNHQLGNIRVGTDFKVMGFTMDERFEVESLDGRILTTLAAEDFDHFLFHVPEEDDVEEEDEDEHLSAPGYYDG